VEEWVNALVEEGYDLSDYTWDEMYEAYSQLDEYAVPLIQAGLRAAPYVLPAIGAATKWLQGQGQSKPKEPVDYGQGSFSSTKDKPAPKPSWEKTTTRPSESSTRMPSPARPPEKKPTEEQKAAAKAAAEKKLAAEKQLAAQRAASAEKKAQVAQSKQQKPPKPAASLGLRKAAKGVLSTVGRVATSGPGKTLLKYGVGVPLVGGLATGAAVDVKRAATGQSSAAQRLSGALQGGAGNVLKTVGSVGAAIPGVKNTGTPQEIQQTGEYLKKAGKDTQKKVDVKRYVELNQSTDLLDIVKNYLIDNKYSNDEESALSIIENMSDEWMENILEAPELGSTNAQGKFYTGPKYGYQSWQTASSKGLLPSEVLGSEPPKARSAASSPKPEPQIGSTNAQGKFYTGPKYGYQSWQTATAKRLLPSESLGSEPPKKASSTPAASAQPAPAKPAPAPAPAPAKPAPAPAKPLETRMSSVTGKREFVGTTADGTKFERRAATGAELRAAQAARKAALVSKPEDKKGAEKEAVKAGVGASRPSGAPSSGTSTSSSPIQAPKPASSTPAPKPVKLPVVPFKDSYEYDAYDLVLEYLLSQGHAGTLEEANYVMLEMNAEMIGDIVEVMTPVPSVIQSSPKNDPKPSKDKKVPQETGVTGDGKGEPMDY